MGNMIMAILTATLSAAMPVASAEISEIRKEQSQSNLTFGRDTISFVREKFNKGEYSDFLKKMDESFKQADLSGFIEMRQKPIPVDFQEKWEQQFSDLQKQKNKDLLQLLADEDDSIFTEKVRSLAANISTPEQEKAISKLHSFIAMAPNSGANEDENTLINIDLEYEYKLLNAKLPMSDVSFQQIQEHQIALRMEKMEKMITASKSFQDHSLKQAVGLAAANFDLRLARNLDGADLNAMTKGQIAPSNELEEKVYSILASYQGQFNDLMKKVNDANP
jgi:hypothetical protein